MTTLVLDVVVIGSGPSAGAAVSALLARGIRPVVIESASAGMYETQPMSPSMTRNIGFKTWNGSDAMYQPHPNSNIRYDPILNVRAANYLGGLSRVWGATYDRHREFRRWPLDCIPDEIDWHAVSKEIPHTTTGASLNADGSHVRRLPMEPRLEMLLLRGSARGPYLFEPSRLAIEVRPERTNQCKASRRCLEGCPHDSIWWAGNQFRRWARNQTIELRQGIWVQSVEEHARYVSINMIDTSGEFSRMRCRHLFVAAGAIATGALAISSGWTDQIKIRDSKTAFGAMLSVRRDKGPQTNTHTLSHLWARDKSGSGFLAQIYPPNESHIERIRDRAPSLPSALVKAINSRLFPFIAYIDSDHSGTLLLSRSGGDVMVQPGLDRGGALMRKHLRRLTRQVIGDGFMLPYLVSDLAPPGGGFHFGASLPHGIQSDEWGRAFGHARIFVVDSSVLPHIEPGSITPTVMANAHRIARTARLEG